MSYKFNFKGNIIEVHESWAPFFTKQKENLNKIETKIGDPNVFTPSIDDIFKIFKKSLDEISFVIIGQDPYPKRGVATGRAFEVSTIDSWKYKKINRSLQNILKSIYYFHHGKTNIKIRFSEIRNNCNNILPPNELFNNLEKNGVFLLNLSLTCKADEPNSHKKLWKDFSPSLIEHIIKEKGHEVKWLIWGKDARIAVENYQNQLNIISNNSPHPSKRGFLEDFILNSGLEELQEFCFKKK